MANMLIKVIMWMKLKNTNGRYKAYIHNTMGWSSNV